MNDASLQPGQDGPRIQNKLPNRQAATTQLKAVPGPGMTQDVQRAEVLDEETLDLSMESLSDPNVLQLKPVEVVKEINAGAFAQTGLRFIVGLVATLSMTVALITLLRTPDEAERYVRLLATLLSTLGKFILTVFGAMLVYYFIKTRLGKDD